VAIILIIKRKAFAPRVVMVQPPKGVDILGLSERTGQSSNPSARSCEREEYESFIAMGYLG